MRRSLAAAGRATVLVGKPLARRMLELVPIALLLVGGALCLGVG